MFMSRLQPFLLQPPPFMDFQMYQTAEGRAIDGYSIQVGR